MMSLLINEYQKRITAFGEKLEKLQNQMVPLKTHHLFPESEAKLKCHLEQFNKNILTKKDKKLQRDRKTFEDGKAYKWQSTQSNGRRPQKQNKNVYNNHHDSLVHSSTVSFPQPPSQQRGRRWQNRHHHGDKSYDESSYTEGSPTRTGNHGCSRLIIIAILLTYLLQLAALSPLCMYQPPYPCHVHNLYPLPLF